MRAEVPCFHSGSVAACQLLWIGAVMKRVVPAFWIFMLAGVLLAQDTPPPDDADQMPAAAQKSTLEERFAGRSGTARTNVTLDLVGTHDSRAIFDGPDLSDTVYLVAPAFYLFKGYSPRTEFRAAYQPELQLYQHDSNLNSVSHLMRAHFSHRFTPRFSFDIADAFVATDDPSRHLGNSFLLLPPTSYRENSVNIGFDHTWSPKTSWGIRFDNTITKYGLPPEFRQLFVDQMGNSITGSLTRRLTEHQRLTGTYSYLALRVLDPQDLPSPVEDYPRAHYLTASYNNQLGPGFSFGLTGGAIRSAEFSYVAGAEVEALLTERLWLDASYTRSISFFGSGGFAPTPGYPGTGLDTGSLSNSYQMVTMGLQGNLSPRASFELRGTWATNNSRITGRRANSLGGHLRLDYQLGEHLLAFALAEVYSQTQNEIAGIPTSRSRFGVGLQYAFGRRRLMDGGGPAAALPAGTGGPRLALP
jgi:hypothetical protein